MAEPSHWAAVVLAWVWAWIGDRSSSWVGECSCNCTREVQAQVCPGSSWWSEGLKLFVYGGLGLLLGAGWLLQILAFTCGGVLRLVPSSWTTTPASPERGRSSSAPVELEVTDIDQRTRALQQLQELRGRRSIRN